MTPRIERRAVDLDVRFLDDRFLNGGRVEGDNQKEDTPKMDQKLEKKDVQMSKHPIIQRGTTLTVMWDSCLIAIFPSAPPTARNRSSGESAIDFMF